MSVPNSCVIVNKKGAAKINYTVELKYMAFPSVLPSMGSGLEFLDNILPPEKTIVLKTYGDFKRLNLVLMYSGVK